MESNTFLLLLGYAAAIFAVSMLGGKLSAIVTLTHTRTQLVMSLVAGFLLGVAMYHLLLHSLEDIPGPYAAETAIGCAVLGIILIVVMLRIFRFHQHDFSHEAMEMHEDHGHHGLVDVNPRSVFGIALGLSLHTVTEGIALGASVRIGLLHDGEAVLAGLGVFLAIMAHKPLDAYSIIGLMRATGYSNRSCTLTNIGFALLCPLVTILTFEGVGLLNQMEELQIVGYIMAFAAGVFLCISLGDLLPEIQFHSHDRGILAVAFLVGLGLAYALFFFESDATHGLKNAALQ